MTPNRLTETIITVTGNFPGTVKSTFEEGVRVDIYGKIGEGVGFRF